MDIFASQISGVQAGNGWKMLMECLAAGRSISLPALSTGGGKLVSLAVGAYARVRRQFRLPIGRFEGVEEALARIAGHTYLMDAARAMTCARRGPGRAPLGDLGHRQVPLHRADAPGSSTTAWTCWAAAASASGPATCLGRAYQAIPIGITVEGANILTRTLIIFGQGVIRCHPYVLKEMRAMADPDRARGLAEFDRHLCGHLAFGLANAARACSTA